MLLNLLSPRNFCKAIIFIMTLSLLFCGFGYARTVKIVSEDENSRLELRNITLPDGTEAQIYVIKGESILVKIDENLPNSTEITASHIEYDQDAALLRIIGEGVFKTQDEEIEGRDFSISLKDDTFDAFQVEIVTGKVVVRGADATRFPGQLDVSTGSFSLCGRCEQEIEDYGFAAEEMRLYPSDRLVAYDVTVLIKDNPIFFLPLLVLPLGPEDKQPRFDLQSGTATSRATSSLHWPYVFAESSFGRLGIKYYADVLADEGDLLSEQFLGGAVATSYFGLEWFHRFYTDRGKANLNFSYVPSFKQYVGSTPKGDPLEQTQDQINLSIDYSEQAISDNTTNNPQVNQQNPNVVVVETNEDMLFGISRPQINFVVRRNDASRQRIGEYELSLKSKVYGYNADFFSQAYYDFDSEDDVKRPSYSNSFGQGGNPNITFAKLTLQPIEASNNINFEFGNLNLSGFLAEIGFFEDDSNSTNRSASQTEVIQALRLLLNQDQNLNITVPFTGTSLSVNNSFKGQYYSTQNPDGGFERLILWTTQVNLTQTLDKFISLRGGLNRTYRQGETPFSFDGNSLQERTDLNFGVDITPFDWIAFNFTQSYILTDSRDANSVGWGNLNSGLRLFDSNNWFNMNLNNTYDFKNEDPGFLRADIHFRFPAPNWYFPPQVEQPTDEQLDIDQSQGDELDDIQKIGSELEDTELEDTELEDTENDALKDTALKDTVEDFDRQPKNNLDALSNAEDKASVPEVDEQQTLEQEEPEKETVEISNPVGVEDSQGTTDVLDTSKAEDSSEISDAEEVVGSDVNPDNITGETDVVEEDTLIVSEEQTTSVVDSDVQDSEVQDSNVQDSDVQDSDVQDSDVQKSVLANGNLQEDTTSGLGELEIPEGLRNDLEADTNEDTDALAESQLDGLNQADINQQASPELPVKPNYNIAFDIDHQQDLKVEEEQRDETKTSFHAFGNYESVLSFDARTAYNYVPITTTEPYPYWDKLTSSITVGTQNTFDTIPNLTISHIHDLNKGRGESLSLSLGASYEPFEFTLAQTFNLNCQLKSWIDKESCDVSTNSFRVLWRDVLQLEAKGFPILPVELLQLDSRLDTQEYSLKLNNIQAFQNESANWSVSYISTYDPFLNTLKGDTGGWKDSSLRATYQLMDTVYRTPAGDIRLLSDISTEYLFADDQLFESYFRNINLTLRGDVFGVLGVAGVLGYAATANLVSTDDMGNQVQTYNRRSLNIGNLSFSTKIMPDVYLAAIFNDTWDLRDVDSPISTQTPWNFQPEIHLIWDRCCWALSGSWDTSDGAISISLGLNDIQQGFSQEFESPFVLPGRAAN